MTPDLTGGSKGSEGLGSFSFTTEQGAEGMEALALGEGPQMGTDELGFVA